MIEEKLKLRENDIVNEKILKNIPSNRSFEKVSETFQLISDPSRLKILWVLCHCKLCVNNIAIIVNMSSPAVSHHLALLKKSELITSEKIGKEVYYTIASNEEAELVHKSVDDIFDIKCCK